VFVIAEKSASAAHNVYDFVVGWIQIWKVFLSPMEQTYCYKKFAMGIPLCQANCVNCCPPLGVLCVNCRDWKADVRWCLTDTK
jgi:hypothetical protein